MRARRMLFAAAGLAFLLPASASAATKTVAMGPAPAVAKQVQKYYTDADAFFPSKTSIHVGDTVRFLPYGFHNVDLPAKGDKPLALLAPTGDKAASSDAAGTPFWFGGQPVVGFNRVLFASAFGKTLTYTSAKGLNSGLPLANKPKPVAIRFTKTGTFTYYCDVHPGMKGTIHVLAKAKAVTSRATDAKRVAKQLAAVVKTAKVLAAKKAPENTMSIGESGAGGVERLAFTPASMTVTRGTTVTFSMPAKSREDHTATTGPGDPEKAPTSYLGKLAGSFNGPAVDPIAAYASEAPTAPPAALTPQLHGNGFWSTGVLDTTSATPLPASGKVTFSAPGTYEFYCLIHPFMHATVTVR